VSGAAFLVCLFIGVANAAFVWWVMHDAYDDGYADGYCIGHSDAVLEEVERWKQRREPQS
jgi:hypothetical protein